MSVQKQASSRLWLCRKGEARVHLDQTMTLAFGIAPIQRTAAYPNEGSRM